MNWQLKYRHCCNKFFFRWVHRTNPLLSGSLPIATLTNSGVGGVHWKCMHEKTRVTIEICILQYCIWSQDMRYCVDGLRDAARYCFGQCKVTCIWTGCSQQAMWIYIFLKMCIVLYTRLLLASHNFNFLLCDFLKIWVHGSTSCFRFVNGTTDSHTLHVIALEFRTKQNTSSHGLIKGKSICTSSSKDCAATRVSYDALVNCYTTFGAPSYCS